MIPDDFTRPPARALGWRGVFLLPLLLGFVALWLLSGLPFPPYARAYTAAEAGPARPLPPEVADSLTAMTILESGEWAGPPEARATLTAYLRAGNWSWMAAHP